MLRTPQECQVTGSSRAVELLQDSTNTTLGTNSMNLGPRLTWWFELWLLLVWCCCFFSGESLVEKNSWASLVDLLHGTLTSPWLLFLKAPKNWTLPFTPAWHTPFSLSTSDVVYDAMWCEGKIHPAKLLSGDIPGIGNEMFSWPWVEYHSILWFTVSPPFFPGQMMSDDALSRKMELNS